MPKVLLAGESWSSTTHHTKGFDTFFTSTYEEGAGPFLQAMEQAEIDVDFMPNHVAMVKFPGTVDELREYDLVILSDIGANTLNLPPQVFGESKTAPDRIRAIRDYVKQGGSLLMVGGYLSFQGIQAMANYRNTLLAEVLPVAMEVGDDREEVPAGATPSVVLPDHPIVAGFSSEKWPHLLGFHRLTAKPNTDVVLSVNDYPLLTVGEYGNGKSAAFASDMAPHWLPPEFLAWDGYARLFTGLVRWLTDND